MVMNSKFVVILKDSMDGDLFRNVVIEFTLKG
jgi:hypothetical protein